MMERSEACYIIEQLCDDYGITIAEREALEMAMRDIEFVDLMPADVAPVVHGEWENHPHAYGFVRCSICRDCNIWGEWADGKKWNFCPNCGADMRERKGDE